MVVCFGTGRLSLSTVDIWGWVVLWWGTALCSVGWVSSIPGFQPLSAGGVPPLPAVTTKNISRGRRVSPAKRPPVENHRFGAVVPTGTRQADCIRITLSNHFVEGPRTPSGSWVSPQTSWPDYGGPASAICLEREQRGLRICCLSGSGCWLAYI